MGEVPEAWHGAEIGPNLYLRDRLVDRSWKAVVSLMPNQNRPGAHDDLVDAIPMNKTKPTTLLFGVGAAVIVLGTVAFTFMGGKKKSGEEGAQAPVVVAPTSTLTPEEQKKHLEITRKSLEAFEAQKKQEAEEKAAKAQPEPPSGGAAPAPAAGGPAPAAPRPAAPAVAAAPAPAPPAKPAKKVSKKDQADLDGLKDIATQLGK